MRSATPLELIPFKVMALFGADDDGDEGTNDDPQEGASDQSDIPKSYDEEYVTNLRNEAAGRRVKAKEATERAEAAEAELAKLKKAEMDDIERLQTELQEATEALAEANEISAQSQRGLLNERIRNEVTLEAIAQDFQDPGDALSMISQDDIVEDGEVNTTVVRKKLKELASKKPYLIKNKFGSGDGGGKGDPPDDATDYEKNLDKYKKQFEQQGRIST